MATAAAATGGTEDPYVENLNMQMICKECKLFPPNLVEEFSSGDMVCGDCGLVLGDRIVDTRSEWRTFANDDQGSDDPSRVGDGANPLLNGSQLSTTIAFGDTSGRSRDLQRAQNKSSHDKSTKNLLAAYKEIGAHCDAIHIPKTAADFAKHLFKIVEDAKAFKGKSQEAIIAGCIFIACRQSGVGRTFREIFALTKVSKKEIGRTFKALEKFFGSEENKAAMQQGGATTDANGYKQTSSTNAVDLVTRFCSQLGLHQQIYVKVSQGLANKLQSIGDLAGRSPLSVAAACIYFASHLLGNGKSAREIGGMAGVSDGTIRTAYKYLYQDREKLVEMDWLKGEKASMSNLPVS